MATRRPSQRLRTFLKAYDPAIAKLALAVRSFLVAEAPDATEIVCDAYSAVASAFSFTERWQEGFCYVATYANHVNLGFQFGTQLPDPERRLKGTGKWMRHLKIESRSQLRDPYVRQLVRAAIAHVEATNQRLRKPKAKPTTIVTTQAGPKRRPRG